MNLESKIEAILFWKGEPMTLKKLVEILGVSLSEISEAINNLKSNLTVRGLVLLEKDGEVTLGTNPELGQLIENLRKEELNKALSKASLETLSIILYKNGASRAFIDYVRGVNSNFTLRALSMRGLVEKINDPQDLRRFIYKPTFELMSYMGVTKIEELPDYENIKRTLSEAEQGLKEAEQEINENTISQ